MMKNNNIRKIKTMLESLESKDQEMVMAFVEFLAARKPDSRRSQATLPVQIARPAEESVVKAIQRLRATYPMLEAGKLLNETSAFMAQHVMQGRPAEEVIDDLEAAFAEQYRLYKSTFDAESA